MAVPVILAALATAGRVAGGVIARGATLGGGMAASSALGSAINPWTRESQYFWNSIGPTIAPDFGLAVQLWHSDRLTEEAMRTLMLWQGATFRPLGSSDKVLDRAWWHAVDLARPMWPMEDYRRWHRGNPTAVPEDVLRDRLSREGRSLPSEQQLYLDDWMPLDGGTILQLATRGAIDDAQADAWLKEIGYTRERERDQLLQVKSGPLPAEILVLLNRGVISEAEAHIYLRWQGYKGQIERERLLGLRSEIPGPSDLVRFAVREVFTPSLTQRYGFHLEQPPDFAPWLAKQGYNETFQVSDPPGTPGGITAAMDWAKAYWISHWQWPSPGQANSFLQRARGDPANNKTWRIPGLAPFTSQNLSDMLKAADYPPHFRPYLEAISYRTMDVRSIRWGVQYQIFDEAEAGERYQDQGYNATTAAILARTDTARFADRDNAWKRSLDQAARKAAVKCTLDLFEAGGIDQPTCEGYLAQAGVSAATSTRLIYQRLACFSSKILTQGISAIRRLYLSGEIDAPLARDRLLQAGVNNPMIDSYLALWLIQLTPHRKRLAATKIQEWVSKGMISYADGALYLQRIGWQNPELILLMSEASVKQAKIAAAAQEAANRSANQTAARLKALMREAAGQQKHLLAELRRAEPVGLLKRLAKKGKLDEADFRARLADQQYPKDAIDYYVKDAYN